MTDKPTHEICGNEMRMKSKLVAPAAVLLYVALSGAPQAGLAARERFVPPVVTAASEIPYPVEVLASGLVTLSLNLGVNGQPPTVQVLRDIPGLTSLTTSTVTGWTYSPGKLDGKPAPSTINIEVVFNPPDALNQNLQMTPVAATTPPAPAGYLPAEVAVGTFAASPRTGPQTGAVVLDVTIDKYGQVKKVDTVRDVPSLTQEAIDTVKRWTINPATFHGKAIASQLVVAFVFRSPTMTTR
jgi:Gram-negative bacterial TonB protein C-terminal